jgi:periplasmic copper chaperone A
MRHLFFAAILAIAPLTARAHDGVHVTAAYARVASPAAQTGAVFMTIDNHAAADDRLIAVASDVAEKVELHTHAMTAEGVMQMLQVTEGFPIPANASHVLDRGGDHVMLIGLTQPLAQGDIFSLTLTFERAGKVVVIVPVNNEGPLDAEPDHSGHAAPVE